MKKIAQELQDRILDYIDNVMPEEERKQFEQLMASDASLQTYYNTLKKLHYTLDELPVEEPSKNFTKVLMDKLHDIPVHNRITTRNGIFLVVGVLLAVTAASILQAAGAFDNLTAMVNPNKLPFTEQYLPDSIPAFNINLKFLINVIILLNLGLAWIVLDKVVFKPYFQKRWQKLN